jgi:hypothetical protein
MVLAELPPPSRLGVRIGPPHDRAPARGADKHAPVLVALNAGALGELEQPSVDVSREVVDEYTLDQLGRAAGMLQLDVRRLYCGEHCVDFGVGEKFVFASDPDVPGQVQDHVRDEVRILGAILEPREAARVRDDAGAVDLRVDAQVALAEEPKVCLAHQVFEIAREAGRDDVARVAGVDALLVRCMVGHHNSFAVKGFGKLGFEPYDRFFVPDAGGRRGQRALAILDDGEVVQVLLRLAHRIGRDAFAEEVKVGPERAAQKAHAAKDHFVLLKHVDFAVGGARAQVGEVLVDLLAKRLVIAAYVDDRFAQLLCPFNASHTGVDVAGEHDHVRIRVRNNEVAKFVVQGREELDAHGLARNELVEPLFDVVVDRALFA